MLSPAALRESTEERPRLIQDADDLVRCLTIELEVWFGLGSRVVPVGKAFELAPPEATLRERDASDRDAYARRSAGDPACLCDRFGRGDDTARDETWLGVVGYLAVSGRLPFESSHLPALLLRRANEEPPSVMRAAPGLPAALGAAIDQCLARDPAERFAHGEALAEALAPAPDARPALPPTLRAWLGTRNPLLVPYLAWSGLFGTLTTVNLAVWLVGQRPDGPADIVLLAARHIGEDLHRLAEAQREVEGAAGHRPGAERIPTPT